MAFSVLFRRPRVSHNTNGQTLKRRSRHRKARCILSLDIRGTGLSGNEFAKRLLDVRKIAVMPNESSGAVAAGHIRIARAIKCEAFADASKKDFAFAVYQN